MVAFSVIVQAGLVPTVARLLHLPMRTVNTEPWALGVRLRDEPQGVDRFTVSAGSPADGRTIEELADLPGDLWVSFVIRDQQLLTVRPDTTLLAGDDVLIIAEPSEHPQLTTIFAAPSTSPQQEPPNEPG